LEETVDQKNRCAKGGFGQTWGKIIFVKYAWWGGAKILTWTGALVNKKGARKKGRKNEERGGPRKRKNLIR